FPLLVGFTVSFVASGSFSTTGGRKEGGGPLYDTPLRVVIAFESLLELAIVLLGRVPEFKVEAVLAFTNLVIKSLRNPPSKHLVFEQPELDRQGPDNLVFGKSGVGKQVLAGSCYLDFDFGLE
nr:hypothetical protein [Tanacetum cinerariifolium]